jgi:hypothetical protein
LATGNLGRVGKYGSTTAQSCTITRFATSTVINWNSAMLDPFQLSRAIQAKFKDIFPLSQELPWPAIDLQLFLPRAVSFARVAGNNN